MKWITERNTEPTTWVAVGVGAVVVSMMVPTAASYLIVVAAITVVAGIILKEKGNG